MQDGKGMAPLADGLCLDDFLPYLLNRISNRLNTDLAEELRGIGMTLPDWRVLAVLRVADGRSIGEVSVYTVIEQSTLSRVVERLVKRGLVKRRSPPEDQRIVNLHMTAKGHDVFETILPIAMRHYRRAVLGLDAATVEGLIETLHKVLENIRRSPYP
ncbi:MarR family winged helix-turn-helix transcriptional regulator [Oceanibacterium hippocampi]|uniref:Transcriptional activatory protein BadR n=1 Tax=Oceanibacterium hippocampi TaxID=745714 RepID=A0A1Y5TXP7_9PROT|nr:MarR family transcriptional regulator [Oceanibacterium hippocampi]SLN76344.1 Transcriptional activatory protein BadR [Oceanibacterium hippocampi]